MSTAHKNNTTHTTRTPRSSSKKIPPDRVLSEVAKHFGVPRAWVVNGNPSHTGNKPVIHRQMAIWLLRVDLGLTLDDIALKLHRSRTTVIRALQATHSKLSNGERRYKEDLKALRKALGFPNRKVLTASNTQSIFADGRRAGAKGTSQPPGAKAKPPVPDRKEGH